MKKVLGAQQNDVRQKPLKDKLTDQTSMIVQADKDEERVNREASDRTSHLKYPRYLDEDKRTAYADLDSPESEALRRRLVSPLSIIIRAVRSSYPIHAGEMTPSQIEELLSKRLNSTSYAITRALQDVHAEGTADALEGDPQMEALWNRFIGRSEQIDDSSLSGDPDDASQMSLGSEPSGEGSGAGSTGSYAAGLNRLIHSVSNGAVSVGKGVANKAKETWNSLDTSSKTAVGVTAAAVAGSVAAKKMFPALFRGIGTGMVINRATGSQGSGSAPDAVSLISSQAADVMPSLSSAEHAIASHADAAAGVTPRGAAISQRYSVIPVGYVRALRQLGGLYQARVADAPMLRMAGPFSGDPIASAASRVPSSYLTKEGEVLPAPYPYAANLLAGGFKDWLKKAGEKVRNVGQKVANIVSKVGGIAGKVVGIVMPRVGKVVENVSAAAGRLSDTLKKKIEASNAAASAEAAADPGVNPNLQAQVANTVDANGQIVATGISNTDQGAGTSTLASPITATVADPAAAAMANLPMAAATPVLLPNTEDDSNSSALVNAKSEEQLVAADRLQQLATTPISGFVPIVAAAIPLVKSALTYFALPWLAEKGANAVVEKFKRNSEGKVDPTDEAQRLAVGAAQSIGISDKLSDTWSGSKSLGGITLLPNAMSTFGSMLREQGSNMTELGMENPLSGGIGSILGAVGKLASKAIKGVAKGASKAAKSVASTAAKAASKVAPAAKAAGKSASKVTTAGAVIGSAAFGAASSKTWIQKLGHATLSGAKTLLHNPKATALALILGYCGFVGGKATRRERKRWSKFVTTCADTLPPAQGKRMISLLQAYNSTESPEEYMNSAELNELANGIMVAMLAAYARTEAGSATSDDAWIIKEAEDYKSAIQKMDPEGFNLMEQAIDEYTAMEPGEGVLSKPTSEIAADQALITESGSGTKSGGIISADSQGSDSREEQISAVAEADDQLASLSDDKKAELIKEVSEAPTLNAAVKVLSALGISAAAAPLVVSAIKSVAGKVGGGGVGGAQDADDATLYGADVSSGPGTQGAGDGFWNRLWNESRSEWLRIPVGEGGEAYE